MSENKEEMVVELYKAYQSTRRTDKNQQPSSQRVEIPQSGYADNQAENADNEESYERVINLYRQARSDLDPSRERNINLILTTAEIRNNDAAVVDQHNVESNTSKAGWLQSAMNNVARFFDFSGLNQWQAAAAFSIVVLVTVTVIAINSNDDQRDSSTVADLDSSIITHVDLPGQIMSNSESVSTNISASIQSTFGFSGSRQPHQDIFRIGVVTADFPVLAVANDREKMHLIIKEINPFIRNTKNQSLIQSLDNVTTTLHGDDNSPVVVTAVNEFVSNANNYFTAHQLQSVYLLGRWTEIVLLTLLLPDDEKLALLTPLLLQGKSISRQVESSLIADPKIIELVQNIQQLQIRDKTSAQDLRQVQRKLQQIKTALL